MEIIRHEFHIMLDANVYLIYDSATMSGAVVDAGRGFREISEEAAKLGVKVEKLLLTHAHFDHVMEAAKWKAAGAKVYVHENDLEMLITGRSGAFVDAPALAGGADVVLNGGETINIGSESLTVIHTPGHTPGSVCYLGDGFMFSGDTLFKGTYGRTDFKGGSARDMARSLNKLFSLPNSERITVYPGHYGETNLGYEALHNPARFGIEDDNA